MSLRIRLIEVDDFSPTVLKGLNELGELVTGPCEQEELKSILDSFDVFWFRLKYRIDAQVLSETTRCRFIVTPVTGIDHIDLDRCDALGIKVICLKGEAEFLKKVRATAELTIALAMDIMRNTARAVQSVKEGQWDRDLFRGNELYEKRVAIVGMGRLGAITAGYFEALGCEVKGFDTDKAKVEASTYAMTDSLEELLEWAEVVSIHVDLHEGSYNLISAKELKAMGPSAYLINTSRGGIVNESDLLEALQEGSIKGAALDVLNGEPDINEEHPLVKYQATGAENIVITPHIGGNTFESFSKTEKFIFDKLVSHLNL